MTPAVPLETAPSKPVKTLWRVLTFLIGCAIVVFLITIIDWQKFSEGIRQLSPGTLLALAIVFLLLNFFRSMRYRALLTGRDMPLRWLYPIGLYHNMLVRLLPFKLGELSYVVLLRSYLNIPADEGISSLAGSRILELLVIVVVGAISLLRAGELFAGQENLEVVFIALVVFTGIPGFYFAGTLIRAGTQLLRRLPFKWLDAVCGWLDKVAAQFDRFRHPAVFARAFFWSFFTYSCSFGMNWLVLQSLNIRLDFATLVVVITMGMFAGAFPFNVSGFGMFEVSWTFG
jgi:glycosyltransferase 2 family protein